MLYHGDFQFIVKCILLLVSQISGLNYFWGKVKLSVREACLHELASFVERIDLLNSFTLY